MKKCTTKSVRFYDETNITQDLAVLAEVRRWRSKTTNLLSENLGYLYQLTANHPRCLHICLWNDDSAEKMGKGFNLKQAQTVYTILEIFVWIYVH